MKFWFLIGQIQRLSTRGRPDLISAEYTKPMLVYFETKCQWFCSKMKTSGKLLWRDFIIYDLMGHFHIHFYGKNLFLYIHMHSSVKSQHFTFIHLQIYSYSRELHS